MKVFLTLIGVVALVIILIVGTSCFVGYVQHLQAPKAEQAVK